ncbi:MAG TPA: hypothetical protein O0X97_05185 [Methanocorpusculum sp.]|nr:hypothetical protein [Methanocorpusculum sp.]
MNTSAKHLMKFVLPAAALLLVLAVLTAGCVSGDDIDTDTAILGDWNYLSTTDDGTDIVMTYHFDAGNTGTVSTAKTTSPIHWMYDEDEKMYMVNYDAIMQQEYFVYGKDGSTEYLYSVGGGYVLTKA